MKVVQIYGKMAVVSFTRLFNIVPYNKPAQTVGATWASVWQHTVSDYEGNQVASFFVAVQIAKR